MRWRTLYIVPSDLLETLKRTEQTPGLGAQWGASPIPGDPTRALLDVNWDSNPNQQSKFESLPGVLPLGHPWEPLPAEAVPLLASFQHFDAAYAEAYARQDPAAAAVASAAAKARVDNPAAVSVATLAVPEVAGGDSVARATRKMGRRFW